MIGRVFAVLSSSVLAPLHWRAPGTTFAPSDRMLRAAALLFVLAAPQAFRNLTRQEG